MADKKAPAKDAPKKPAYQIYKAYKVEGDKVVRKAGLCPKCEGSLLASHKDRKTCGKCGYMEKIQAKAAE